MPEPRDLIAAAGGTPALAAAARAADLAGEDAACGVGRKVLRPPWRVLPLRDTEVDIEEWDPDDPGVTGDPGGVDDLAWEAVCCRLGRRREKREWLGI